MRLRRLQVYPAARLRAGHSIQPDQLADAQATTVQQLGQTFVTRLQARVVQAVCSFKVSQLHGFVHAQRFGQGLGRLGRTQALHRVAADQTLAPQPDIKATPARQNQGNATGTAPAGVHL